MGSKDPWECLRPFYRFGEVLPFSTTYLGESGFSFIYFNQNSVLQQMEIGESSSLLFRL